MANKQNEDLLIDKRLIERYIARGLLDREDYELMCQKTPDLADRCETIGGEAASPGEGRPLAPRGERPKAVPAR